MCFKRNEKRNIKVNMPRVIPHKKGLWVEKLNQFYGNTFQEKEVGKTHQPLLKAKNHSLKQQ